MAFAILGTPKPAFFDSSGSPLVSGTLEVRNPADDTSKLTYPTADDADALTNPNGADITLNARGECDLWGVDGEDYKLTLKDEFGATIWTVDNVELDVTQSLIGQNLWPRTTAEITAGVTPSDYAYEPGNVLRYGMTGAGNETAELLNAIAACAAGGYTLKGEPGTTYTITTSSAINISGVLNIDFRGCILDCSASTSTVLFDANGTKTNIKTGLTFANGDGIIDITSVSPTPERGDTILISSAEAHPNTARATYYKGTRTYVDSVVGTDMRVYPQIDFDYTASAYVWTVVENELRWIGGRVIGNSAINQAGLVCTLCNAEIEVDFDYCASACIRFEATRGSYKGTMRYPYIVNGGTNYGIAVTDFSEISITNAHITGTRHAVTVGGGTWSAADSGGSGAAAYPASCTINGGFYGSSRTGTVYATDPSLEIGAIDCHGIAKLLMCTGATIYGGCKLGAAESCLISGNTIFNHNYACFEIVDSNSYDWGNIHISNNECFYIGAPDPAGSPAAQPELINAGSTVAVKRLRFTNNSYTIRDGLKTGVVNSFGLLRGFDDIIFNDNKIHTTLPAVTDDGRFEIWGRNKLEIQRNVIENGRMLLRPVRTSTSNLCIANIESNRILGSVGSGLAATINSLDALATFKELSFRDNTTRDCQNSGIQVRADNALRMYFINNVSIDNNAAAAASNYLNSGIGMQTIASTDILELLVLSGNITMSTSDATAAHDQGINVETGSAVTTEVWCMNNIADGWTTADITGLGSAGQTVVLNQGNTNQTIEDYTTGAHTTLRDFTGTTTAAEALQLLETLVDDLVTQGLLK